MQGVLERDYQNGHLNYSDIVKDLHFIPQNFLTKIHLSANSTCDLNVTTWKFPVSRAYDLKSKVHRQVTLLQLDNNLQLERPESSRETISRAVGSKPQMEDDLC